MFQSFFMCSCWAAPLHVSLICVLWVWFCLLVCRLPRRCGGIRLLWACRLGPAIAVYVVCNKRTHCRHLVPFKIRRAHVVVASHPLRMRKALGSNPSVSISNCQCAGVEMAGVMCPDCIVVSLIGNI